MEVINTHNRQSTIGHFDDEEIKKMIVADKQYQNFKDPENEQ